MRTDAYCPQILLEVENENPPLRRSNTNESICSHDCGYFGGTTSKDSRGFLGEDGRAGGYLRENPFHCGPSERDPDKFGRFILCRCGPLIFMNIRG